MERRNNNALDDENERIVICSSASYCYFTLSILLFSVGTVITILALDENDGVFSNLTHMWLVGPLFISSGLMVAVKTIMYLRKETMIMFLTRQRTLLRVSISCGWLSLFSITAVTIVCGYLNPITMVGWFY